MLYTARVKQSCSLLRAVYVFIVKRNAVDLFYRDTVLVSSVLCSL